MIKRISSWLLSYQLFLEQAVGWRRRWLLMASGAVLTLAFPPVYIVPAAFVGLSTFFVLLLASSSCRDAWWSGWWFGFGHFISSLYWIAMALTTDLVSFGWLIPFTILGIPAGLAFFTAIASYATYSFAKQTVWRYALFSVVWLLLEYIRGHIFTGFPWNLLGYVWVSYESVLQLASVVGVWGLSFLSVFWFTSPILWTHRLRWYRQPFIWLAVVLAVGSLWGHQRLQRPIEYHSGVNLRVVQANISQSLKWEEGERLRILQKHLTLSQQEGFNRVTHVLWPESSVPFSVYENAEILDVLRTASPPGGFLMAGTVRIEWDQHGFLSHLYNSMHAIDDSGKILAHYDKSHLVPFGEYVPLRSILPLKKITAGMTDFTAGQGVQTLRLPTFPSFSPLICYEAIFPSAVSDGNDRPELLINVTNDGWYGNNSGPYQHFEMVRVRAVEEGMPLVRVANTGISAIVDSYGRVVKKIGYGKEGVIDSRIPLALPDATLYQRIGILGVLGIMILILSVYFLLVRHKA